jgi:hypothetical protein
LNETFDTYGSSAELHNAWAPGDPVNGLLFSDGPFDPEHAEAMPDGGNALEHIGGPVLQYTTSLAGLKPTETENVRVSFDLYDSASSANKRLTLGLRQDSGTANLFEMGMYNSVPGPFYMFRFVGFPGVTFDGALEPNAGWYAFHDLVDDAGAPITPPAVGQSASVEGWHRFTAEFSPTQATLTLDLNRDGNINATAVVDYTGFHTDGSGGFDNVRIGGPSNVTSAGGGALWDNVMISLVTPSEPGGDGGDFDGDGDVDGADFIAWQQGLGISDGSATTIDGDANNDGNVDAADLGLWQANFGPGASAVAISAVPEPATLALAAGAALACLAAARRR